MRVAILHMYSVENAGDGLLVREAIELVREAFGEDVEISIAGARLKGADLDGVSLYCAMPSRRGYDRQYLSFLRSIADFDVVVGVGGGYLRSGTPLEAAKCLLVHGPQLAASAWFSRRAVYLPQSVGPARFGVGRIFHSALSRLDRIYLRDDRSLVEFNVGGAVRCPDSALLRSLDLAKETRPAEFDRVPVLSVRRVRKEIPADVRSLAAALEDFDGYVQSTVGGNDDTLANKCLRPRSILSREELMSRDGPRRVVVSMRLHGALMALEAGHVVVHLAYERKGYGAYFDLGLQEFVHNAFDFDPTRVRDQVRELADDQSACLGFRRRVESGWSATSSRRSEIVRELRG